MGATAAVLGASGYAGGEVLRLLAGHPALTLAAAAAGRHAGAAAADVHPHLFGSDIPLATIADALAAETDVVFSCLPSGELGGWLPDLEGRVIVDLSDEHRSAGGWLYGLTEFVRPSFPVASVANPGCYPTATLLALLPFARVGAIEGPVVIDALSGISGAGRKATDELLYGSIAGNAVAYGTTHHRHVPEMERGMAEIGGAAVTISFTPHLVPLTRGLIVTARTRIREDLDDAAAIEILRTAYEHEPFVHVIDGWPGCAPVAGTNHALVSARVDPRGGWLIASAAIDNLGKGAAGQAIQNANLALGVDETVGLEATAPWP